MRHYEGNNYGHETTQVDDDEVQFIASSSSKAEDSMESWTFFFGFYIYIYNGIENI